MLGSSAVIRSAITDPKPCICNKSRRNTSCVVRHSNFDRSASAHALTLIEARDYAELRLFCLDNKRILSQGLMLETDRNERGQARLERAMRRVFTPFNQLVPKTLTVLCT